MSRFGERAQRRALARTISRTTRSAEERYVRGLRAIMRGIHTAYVETLLEHYPKRQDALPHPKDGGLELLGLTIHVQIADKVKAYFDKMGVAVNGANLKAYAKLIPISQNNLGITAQLRAAREANIRLIEDAHRDYAAQVREVFDNALTEGLRVEELAAKLAERGDVSESRAELIARDQTLKLNGQITRLRQQAAGVEEYIWSTSQDERVRPEHAALEGRKFAWDEPTPIGYAPSEDFQCRCIPIPVIPELEDDSQSVTTPEE